MKPLISKRSMMPAWHQLVPISGHVEESETARKLQLYATSIKTSVSTRLLVQNKRLHKAPKQPRETTFQILSLLNSIPLWEWMWHHCTIFYSCTYFLANWNSHVFQPRRGGTDLERGYGDVWSWRPPFHASPVVCKGPISSKSVSSQDPLLRKFWNFSLYSLNFCPNFSSQAPKLGNFQLTSPKLEISVHKPPNLEIFSSQAPPLFQRQTSVRKPHTSEIGAAHHYLNKSWVPPQVSTPPDIKYNYVISIFKVRKSHNQWVFLP